MNELDVGHGGRGTASLPVVVIDPGHGGRQPGAVGVTGLTESWVVLQVALRVREMLRGRVNVELTRENDTDVALRHRIAPADARAFISIHCNGFTDRAANGTETFWQQGGAAASQRLATVLQQQLVPALGRRNRGVKVGNFQVLRQARVPAALVELAFITNVEEEQLLRSQQTHERAAQAIVDAVLQF